MAKCQIAQSQMGVYCTHPTLLHHAMTIQIVINPTEGTIKSNSISDPPEKTRIRYVRVREEAKVRSQLGERSELFREEEEGEKDNGNDPAK